MKAKKEDQKILKVKPFKLLFSKRVFDIENGLKFYGTFLGYVRFCRLNGFEIHLKAEEF